jgi:Ner family transcriptional regulator
MARPKGWHPEQVKAALRQRFGSLSALSLAWGLNPAAISAALQPGRRSSGVERRIAEALDVSPFVIWPDRWSPDGNPLPRGADGSRAAPTPHRQNEEAA